MGSVKFKVQNFTLQGVSTALITLTSISIFVLILPNYIISHNGGEYTSLQLLFVSLISLLLYLGFTMMQTIRHRSYFISPENRSAASSDDNGDDDDDFPDKPSNRQMGISILFLILCLGIVVLLAKLLSGDVESIVKWAGAPKSLVGIIIAGIVLLPEGMAAFRAARNNQIQTSLNLAFGSALANIGLSIPPIAITSVITGIRMTLGIDIKSTILLGLTLFIITISLATGRTNIMQGFVLVAIFLVYLFTVIIP